MNEYLTTQQAADFLGMSRGQLIFYIRQGSLSATKFGSQYAIKEEDVRSFHRNPIGRPRKGIHQ